MAANKFCAVCASKIPFEAKKCVKCGSYQDFRRHFDIGNTTLALILALISVASLSFDKFKDIYEYIFYNDAKLYFSIESIDKNQVSVFVLNTGGSPALLGKEIDCDIPIYIDMGGICNRDEFCSDRGAKSEMDVKTIVKFSYSLQKSSFLESKQRANFSAVNLKKAIEWDHGYKTKDISGNCFFRYLNQSGEERFALATLGLSDALDFVAFDDYDRRKSSNERD